MSISKLPKAYQKPYKVAQLQRRLPSPPSAFDHRRSHTLPAASGRPNIRTGEEMPCSRFNPKSECRLDTHNLALPSSERLALPKPHRPRRGVSKASFQHSGWWMADASKFKLLRQVALSNSTIPIRMRTNNTHHPRLLSTHGLRRQPGAPECSAVGDHIDGRSAVM
jgi:hypothetical protein